MTFGILFFLDGWDLHIPFGVNLYGPVLFVMDLALLNHEKFRVARITRSNPSNWSSEPRFYDSLEEVEQKYLAKEKFDKSIDGGIMFLLDSPEANLSLINYCRKIILDDPKVATSGGNQVFDLVKSSLETALAESNLENITIERRHLDEQPYFCYRHYHRMVEHNLEKFNLLFSKSYVPKNS